MPTYRVTWEIDIDATTPQQAALKAYGIQQDLESAATIFGVVDPSTNAKVDIDASELDESILEDDDE